MLESEGLKYISTPRTTGWGGAAIIVNQEYFSLEKLNIHIPHNLEIIWGLMKPKDENATHKKIILCSFYSPPNSKKNTKLTDHIITTLQLLSTQYPDSPMILGADRNSMNISPILNCGLRMKQCVGLPTRVSQLNLKFYIYFFFRVVRNKSKFFTQIFNIVDIFTTLPPPFSTKRPSKFEFHRVGAGLLPNCKL